MKTIILNEEMLPLFRESNTVIANGNTYVRFQFWLKETENINEYELIRLENLPEGLEDGINKMIENPDTLYGEFNNSIDEK